LGSITSQRILVAPLDWGLGHTTRLIPIIRHLYSSNNYILFAGNESQRSFILQVFPDMPTIHLDGYDVRYSRSRSSFMAGIALQIPRLLQVIRRENHWLQQVVASHHIDVVISDNRYGLYHPNISSVILTHQLRVQSGLGSLVDGVLQRLHYRFLQRFSDCWVVDLPEAPGIAGSLSHPSLLPNTYSYLGLLSQMSDSQPITYNSHLLILLSGPEPQRTILSQLLWQQAIQLSQPIVFVEGTENVSAPTAIPPHITYHKRLAQGDLQPLLNSAHTVICRSGYSSVMDILALGKKSILIPTPGQTEQEYLAQHLHYIGACYTSSQLGFQLSQALSAAASFPYSFTVSPADFHLHKQVIDAWLAQL
jgi:Glycosyltransferase family 28 C-terminal domain